jgi:hypothetical protein
MQKAEHRTAEKLPGAEGGPADSQQGNQDLIPTTRNWILSTLNELRSRFPQGLQTVFSLADTKT